MIPLAVLRAALALPAERTRAARLRMAPAPRGLAQAAPPREAAVLLLLVGMPAPTHLLLTRRQDALRGHSGQVSFPGGRRDPEDADLITTALRETCEELGVCTGVEVLGVLETVYIPPSNFDVLPVVGYLPALTTLAVSAAEVAEVLSMPLASLLDAACRAEEMHVIEGYRVRVPYYRVGDHKVWGATAIMLADLAARLRLALPPGCVP